MCYSHPADKANQLNQNDTLKHLRDAFALPSEKIYFCSHSLGLPAKNAEIFMRAEMQKWSALGAHAWFADDGNWYTSQAQTLREQLSKLLGTMPTEVAVMNSLTINLHLLLTSFYRPTKTKFKIITDAPTFPSDLYALKSHLNLHQLDIDNSLIIIQPELLEKVLEQEGEATALLFLNTVNYLTGQIIDIEKAIALSHQYGCVVGLDLAHAAGNIPLNLHQSGADFAVGCSYKYLCGGPGSPGFIFVNQKHHNTLLPRLSGWWGNDPSTRFQMDLQKTFIPHGGAASWQVSTPSILAMQPLLAALNVFNEVGMDYLRQKSIQQTDFFIELLDNMKINATLITPRALEKRGCQLSLQVSNARELANKLLQQDIICDIRPPNVLRISFSPLYNTFEDIFRLVSQLAIIN